MDIETISTTMQAVGVTLPTRLTTILLLVLIPLVPILIAVAVFGYGYWKKKQAPKTPVDAASPGPSGAALVDPKSLRQAWRRWMHKLPGSFQRSILNFDHYVLLGAPSSGKSKLVDIYTDWRRQAKQLPGTESFDAALPVYLGSGAVITEISGRILEDHGRSSKVALEALWKPLYKQCSPTVLAVVDAARLKEGATEAVEELAESVRAKVNILSAIRGRAITVRIVLTHLDALEGYAEFARFCKDQAIERRFNYALRSAGPDVATQFEAWLEAMRAQLPRALVNMPSAEYLKVVAFLRSVPDLAEPLTRFVASLFAKEALAKDPLAGGVYFASDVGGVANPLRAVEEHTTGPDPRRKHLAIAATLAAMIVGYLGFSYREQRALFVPAQAALDQYVPARNGGERERFGRGMIAEFAYKKTSWLDTHPGYFNKARTRVREEFADRVRQELLVPQLRRLASNSTEEGTSPARRSLFMLALIHADKNDGLKILDAGRLDVWAKMTNLPPDIIRDYVKSTDVAWRTPIEFDLAERDTEIRESVGFWLNFLRSMQSEVATGVIGPETLRDLQTQAQRGATALTRFDSDDVAKGILDQLDIAAGTASARDRATAPLRLAYLAKYSEYQSTVVSHDVFGQRDRLQTIVRIIRSGSVDAGAQKLLRVLGDRIAKLYADTPGGEAEEVVKIHLGTEDFTFDPKRWRQVIRDSNAKQLVVDFVTAASSDGSIFFGADQLAELRPVDWNPNNDGSSFFTGKGAIDARYTHVAYDKHVRDVAVKLEQVLEKSKVPDEQRKQLREYIRDEVRRYATEYRSQTVRFIASFGLRAASPEALRVTIEQMQSDGSAFNDFIVAVDQNTKLEAPAPTLYPMRDAMADFASWHAVATGDGGAAEVTKYRAILKQLLTDLTPSQAASGTAAGDASGPNDTLEKALSPVGRIALADLLGDKGAYASLVAEWVQSIHLPDYQRAPFLAPIELVTRIGRADIQDVVRRVWERDMVPDVQRIARRFPFDRESKEDTTPRELEAAFHPQTGRFFDQFRRYIEPLADIGNGPFREKRSVSGRIKIPAELFPTTNSVATLAAALWDTTGAPKLLETQIATVPFEHGKNPRLALTLVYLNAGAASVFNFNQKPSQLTVRIPWNVESNSQVGVQLTDLDAKENAFPEPIAAEGSHFSLLHLLAKGAPTPIKQPPNAQLYTWTITVARGGMEKIPARFVVIGDPFAPFKLGRFAHAPVAASKAAAPN